MANLILRHLMGFLSIFRIEGYNKYYWDLRAKDIDKKWGDQTDDFDVLKTIITDSKPDRILDIGCGSGRLFPLYRELGITEIVAQDISAKAIEMANRRAKQLPGLQVRFENKEITTTLYPAKYFGLVISNRTLSAIFPEQIGEVIERLCKYSNRVYINEMTDLDYHTSQYWFRHDYKLHFKNFGFDMIKNGIIPGSKKEWFIYQSNVS